MVIIGIHIGYIQHCMMMNIKQHELVMFVCPLFQVEQGIQCVVRILCSVLDMFRLCSLHSNGIREQICCGISIFPFVLRN